MDKKGFTLVEVVVSFSILSVLLVSVITFTITYRDKIREEETRTQLIDFKNTIMKVVYDDIIMGKYKGIEQCVDVAQCVNFIDNENALHPLKVVEVSTGTDKGLYLEYDEIKYLLPDSDLNKIASPMCWFNSDFQISNYDNLYTLKMTFKHEGFDEQYEILITID